MEEAQASEFEPVSVSVSEPEQEDTKSPVVDEEEPDTSSAEIAVKTLVEGAIAHAISAAELQDSEPVPMLEQEEEKLSNVEGDAAAPSLEPPSVEGVSKTPVEDDASAAVTVLEEAGTAEPEPVLEPEQDYVEPSDVDGDAAAASSSKPPSGQEPIVKALVEDAIAHAVSAAVLQDAAEASLQLTSDVPAKSEHGTDSGDMEQKEARQDDAKLPPKSPERVSEKKEVDERASPPSKSSGVLLETTNKPASAGESISDDGVRDESDSMSESSPKQRNYQNLTEVRSSLEDIHIMTQEAKRNLEKEESARDVAKQNAQRPWETDLALFKGLSKSGAEHRHDEADDEVVKKPATRREARRKKTRKAKAPQAGSKREVVERKIATTQTESKSPQRVDPQERASEEKSPKEVILLELKRIKKEYLSAIKQAQRALKTQDPSINKVLASQVETLKDYDEILEMATGSVPEQSEDKSYPEPELRKPAEPEIPSATLATKKGVMESDEESPSSQSPSSDSPSSSDEQEEERRRRRKRAAEMLRKIVSNSRSRRKSKETLEANQKIVEDASTSEGPVVTDYRKDMPLKEQTDNLLDQMGKAVELSSQTTLHQGDGREDSHTEDADDNQTAVAPSQEELEAPKLAQQGHGGEEGKGEEDESTDVARELDIETQEARPLLGIPLERDPAFDLFAHFFELKSTDPTRHLREKFKSSPHTRYGSIKRNNFKSFLFQLSEFCGSGFSKNELLYIELLFDAVISVTGRTTSRMSEPPSWEIVEERFVQISWHYYQGIRRKEMNLEFMLASTKEHVSECSEDVEGSLANDLGLSEVSEIPLSQLPAVLAAFFSKISMDLSVRDVCLVFWDCMHSRLARSETFDLTTLMDLMQPESMRRKEVPRLEVTKSPTSDENLPILEPEPAAEPPREEKEEETQPAAEPPREEKEEETQPAVEPPREEKEEETQPAAEPPREEKEEETQPAVEPPREEEEEPEPAAEPPQEEKEGETRGEVVRELGVSSLEVSDEEETTHIEDEGPQAIKGSLSEAQDQTQAPPPANDVEESLGVIEPAREDRLPGIPAYVSDAVETCLQEAKAVDFVESEPVSALPEVLERKEEGGAARSESEESMPERGPAISSGSSMDKINLNEILLDIKGGEENWLKVSKAPPSSGASYGSHAFADFFDVQSISMSDFQQSSPREVLHLQALDPEPGRRKTTMARKNMLVPASNVELEELFAEMDEMERKEESLPKRKTKAEKKLEKETRSALSKLKTKQNARRERVKQELKAERKRYAEAEKRAKENVLKYAKLRQQNYESILADVQTALVEAEVAAYTLETENEELHDFLEEMSSEQNESHTKYISKLQDHLSLVEAQIGAAAE
ncbi:hypothetical protein A3770_03p20010 [Chloropicon primus]|uniref:Uncharacterized protein n=2 Tax=Chloropicon primus TaxID=1764295 RepID=A0A5B8MGD2_9CHLO|nr:hypothetical protein A3770_03p20010 [Chloropicon primus]|eukprot:QDZ19483.1 hypothetical protein A3770_03p20010 [Chloropicon primus]